MKTRKNDIERYLRGELSPAEMHALEKEALNDPFLAEALEGVEQAGADNFLYDLHALNRSVHNRARGKNGKKNRIIKMWGWTAGIAATVLLVAVSGFLVVHLLYDQHAHHQAMKREAPAPQEPVPQDSVTDEIKSSPSPTETEADSKARDATRKSATPATEDERADAKTNVSGEETLAVKERVGADPHTETNTRIPAETSDSQVDSRRQGATEDRPDDRTLLHPDAVAERESFGQIKQADDAQLSRTPDEPASRASGPVAKMLTGKVVSAEDGEALPGVIVRVKGTSIGSVTDAEGNYEIRVPGDQNKLVFSFIGFETREVDAGSGGPLDVQLETSVEGLSEVVVTGYGNPSTKTPAEAATFRVAEPANGKNRFREYLLDSLRYPAEALKNKVEGKVSVRFTVQPDGALTNFEVLRGIGFGCEEELIRLIRRGPAWEPATQGGTPVADKVKVRFRFTLPE